MSETSWWRPLMSPLSSVRTRYQLNIWLTVLFYLTFEHTIWIRGDGSTLIATSLIPIPAPLWYSVAWGVLAAGLALLLCSSRNTSSLSAADSVAVSRQAIVAVALMGGVELLERMVRLRLNGQSDLSMPLLGIAILGVLVGIALLLLGRVPSGVVVGSMLACGLAIRLLGLVVTPIDGSYADNLVVIQRGLERLFHLEMPYAVFDVGGHLQPLTYLPWTVLSYAPSYALGMDIRVSNVVMSLCMLVVAWRARRVLARSHEFHGMLMVIGVMYLSPLLMGHDLFAEFQLFNLAIVLTFMLAVERKPYWAAAAFGVALGAMPVAIYFAPSLLAYSARSASVRTNVIIALIVVLVAGMPVLLCLMVDAPSFIGAILYSPRVYWARLATGQVDWPFLLAWHHLPPSIVHTGHIVVLVASTVLTLWFVRSGKSMLVAGTMSYLLLVLSGPYIVSHMMTVLFLLLVLAELTNRCVTSPASRTIGGSVQREPVSHPA